MRCTQAFLTISFQEQAPLTIDTPTLPDICLLLTLTHMQPQLKAQKCFHSKGRRALQPPSFSRCLAGRGSPSPCIPAPHPLICLTTAQTLVNHTHLPGHTVQFRDAPLPRITSRLYYSHLKKKKTTLVPEIQKSPVVTPKEIAGSQTHAQGPALLKDAVH